MMIALFRYLLALSLLTSTMVRALPSLCPRDQNIVGYSDWNVLFNDIRSLSRFSAWEDATFVVCPGTTFYPAWAVPGNRVLRLDYDFAQQVPPITLQCGPEGTNSTHACTVKGGLHHVVVQRVQELAFEGITFEGATRGSVWIEEGTQQVSFKDCIWENNVYNWDPTPAELDRPTLCPTGCYGAVGGRHSAATFENCWFVNNEGDSGAVYGLKMDYTFVGCEFRGNKARASDLGIGTPPTGSAITLHDPASTLSLTDTCMEDNASQGPATVLVECSTIADLVARENGAPALRVNSHNYFNGNRVEEPNHDIAFQWCQNSIYNFVRNGENGVHEDDCVPAHHAKCCHCEDETETPNISVDMEANATRGGGGEIDLLSGLAFEGDEASVLGECCGANSLSLVLVGAITMVVVSMMA